MNAVYTTIWFIVCLIAQVLIFNHLALWGGIVLFYVYILIKMPVEVRRPWQIVIGFSLGLLIDLFTNTPGMHALTSATVMYLRMPILHLYVVADDFKAGIPNRRSLSQSVYTRFCLSIVLVHTVLLYFIEAFTCFNFLQMIAKILITIALTSVFFLSIEAFQYRHRQKD